MILETGNFRIEGSPEEIMEITRELQKMQNETVGLNLLELFNQYNKDKEDDE